MLNVSRQSGRKFMKNEACNWKGEHCKENHLMRDCLINNALDNRGKLDHIMKVGDASTVIGRDIDHQLACLSSNEGWRKVEQNIIQPCTKHG
jgi:hypothetical protein